MFGTFQALLADLPGKSLNETIVNFHNIEWRLETFEETLENDPKGRAKDIPEEIKFVRDRAEEMKTILNLGRQGKIPLRITHNDTKFNNVLLDQKDKGLCVIDLDTVMPGVVMNDFGDAIRFGASTAAEDEKQITEPHHAVRHAVPIRAKALGIRDVMRKKFYTTTTQGNLDAIAVWKFNQLACDVRAAILPGLHGQVPVVFPVPLRYMCISRCGGGVC